MQLDQNRFLYEHSLPSLPQIQSTAQWNTEKQELSFRHENCTIENKYAQ